MDRDRRGRKRQVGQDRGLRPLHPLLPSRWESRALRVAMPEADWDRFEALVDQIGAKAPTQARAYGQTLSQLVHSVPAPEPGPLDWMDWERRKTLRLIFQPVISPPESPES